MTEEDVKKHGFMLLTLYYELIHANEGYKHDPEAHNLCTAVCEKSGYAPQTYISYSNLASLSTAVKRYVAADLVPDVPVHQRLINRGGMQDLHTEIRLINYLYSIGRFNSDGVISFFSTRSICKTCAAGIYAAQTQFSRNVAFIGFELKAEEMKEFQNVYIFNTQRGSGSTRDFRSEQGAVGMDI